MKEVGRLAVEEIYFDVLSGEGYRLCVVTGLPLIALIGAPFLRARAGAQITFDYIAYIVIGGIIAAIGLATNSPVMVVASMLVSLLSSRHGTALAHRCYCRCPHSCTRLPCGQDT